MKKFFKRLALVLMIVAVSSTATFLGIAYLLGSRYIAANQVSVHHEPGVKEWRI